MAQSKFMMDLLRANPQWLMTTTPLLQANGPRWLRGLFEKDRGHREIDETFRWLPLIRRDPVSPDMTQMVDDIDRATVALGQRPPRGMNLGIDLASKKDFSAVTVLQNMKVIATFGVKIEDFAELSKRIADAFPTREEFARRLDRALLRIAAGAPLEDELPSTVWRREWW